MFCEWYAEGAEPRLQHAITASLDDHVFHARLQHFATPLHDRIRIISCAGRNAGAWLRARPSCKQLTLPNSDFRIAARLRAGLPPLPRLPSSCKCGEEVAGIYDDHFLACKKLCPTALRHRHDNVVRLMADLFRKAGAPVRIEPRPIDGKKDAPDVEVILPGERLSLTS